VFRFIEECFREYLFDVEEKKGLSLELLSFIYLFSSDRELEVLSTAQLGCPVCSHRVEQVCLGDVSAQRAGIDITYRVSVM